jgi:hypothetical protein
MEQNELILEKLSEIANKLEEQNVLKKPVINFNDACKYLDVSPSHLYKLTSARQIPHFCPQGGDTTYLNPLLPGSLDPLKPV